MKIQARVFLDLILLKKIRGQASKFCPLERIRSERMNPGLNSEFLIVMWERVKSNTHHVFQKIYCPALAPMYECLILREISNPKIRTLSKQFQKRQKQSPPLKPNTGLHLLFPINPQLIPRNPFPPLALLRLKYLPISKPRILFPFL